MVISYAYQQLAETCFRLRQQEGFPLCAIDWLHFSNARSDTQKAILSGLSAPRFLESLLRGPWLLLRSFHLCFLVVWTNLVLRHRIATFEQSSFDLVAKTWTPSAKIDVNDFYYGDFQKRIGAEQRTMLLLCGNVSRKNWRNFLRQFDDEKSVNQIPDICFFTLSDILRMFFLQCFAAFRMHRLSRRERDPLRKNIVLWARTHLLRFQTMMNGLNFFLAARVVRQFQPKAYVALYEGHAWEECSWRGVKSTGLSCKTVGYQHTVIMSRALDLLKPESNGSIQPDIILCSGRRSLEMMQKGIRKNISQYLVFGSFRTFKNGASLRPHQGQPVILVTPEGILEEAALLFNVAIETAQKLKGCHFIFRCHPVLPMTKVLPVLNSDPGLLPNIEMSSNNFDADLDRSSILFYRGSSTVLYAILKGLRPIYYHTGGEIIDPLHELSEWKINVASSAELQKVLANWNRNFDQESEVLWKKAKEYVQDYVLPVEDSSLKNFLGVLN
ncbi:MAG: hypothetical protein A2W61_06280 [Deltaproteobacteria bacterium RIFCSPLOWO2_01_44_7]|nr:MAG: hypothetical protein A2712_02780 [Deltaproteobacteria bacterium RIFCSPHIGHO2_01_FULL_43_49]OGQ16120.1 MAG: hypothetical protein A3D22_00750 [Deltaproteobacteria bacterium RIFCSPHIGHO2_02_FULL_44_53]OGQ29081.1 MAG: hypothetical protein A3D98_04535 [Deltaproteobacteria bacterium RIFCSPHIGHO2_12_FULL_44_21]OGQ32637.1 MAG: hypothetical protein A2979_08680 [Deltaproteobacteria bacterium RIFCSPLOWO2_01_FULL_45_74]OGQ38023.1 MAG: hypothetical protein A2W61_06280 [Deltaproteobacteria bacterium 